ncbi:MAG: helix-turn-helix domain-containing protein [Coriobacteriales bacterium]|nr:helix-turn-helix domain-containing protein [Coriobacteriales bacterium]
MSEAAFGERLAEARRIKGESIEDVSDQLRIRPSIIQALETSNFAYMPHKGYTRNMVSSYARYLGLDSTRITEQFLREFHRYENSVGGRLASNGRLNTALDAGTVRHSGPAMEPGEAPAGETLPITSNSSSRYGSTQARRSAGNPAVGRINGRLTKKDSVTNVGRGEKPVVSEEAGVRTAYQHHYLDDQRETITAAKRNQARSSYWGSGDKRQTDQQFKKHLRQMQGENLRSARYAGSSYRGDRRLVDSSGKQVRTNDYVGKPPRASVFSSISSTLFNRPVLLIIGLIVIFLAILIAWAVVASNCSRNETTNLPSTGASSTDTGISAEELGSNLPAIEEQIAEDNRYGPFELLVEVSGGASWLQIDVDGATPIAEICEPPWQGNYTVSSSCRIEAGAPGNVKVYRNGIEVALGLENGLGILELAVEQRPIAQNAQNAG